jgi:hypothetical protein
MTLNPERSESRKKSGVESLHGSEAIELKEATTSEFLARQLQQTERRIVSDVKDESANIQKRSEGLVAMAGSDSRLVSRVRSIELLHEAETGEVGKKYNALLKGAELTAKITELPQPILPEPPLERPRERSPILTGTTEKNPSVKTEQSVKSEAVFDAQKIYIDLQKNVEALFSDEAKKFYSQFHPDDLNKLQGVLNRRRSSGPEMPRFLADFFSSKSKNLSGFARNETRHTKEEIDKIFISLTHGTDHILDGGLDRQTMFGTSDLNTAKSRLQAMLLAPLTLGFHSPSTNIARYALQRAIDKNPKPEQQAKLESEMDPAARATERYPQEDEGAMVAPSLESKRGGLELEPKQTGQHEKQQEWLDKKREATFAELNSIFKNLEQTGGQEAVRQWLQDTFNPLLQQAGRESISMEDLSSMHYLDYRCEPASEVAGQEIRRPVFIFDTDAQYDKFSELFFNEPDDSEGCIMRWQSDDEILKETGIIISKPYKGTVDHETLHTVDPHVIDRTGINQLLLTEAFALYQEAVINNLDGAYAHIEPGPDRPWQLLSIRLNSYQDLHKQYDPDSTLNRKQFEGLVKNIVNALRTIAEREGHLETQRKIARTKTLEELFAFAI